MPIRFTSRGVIHFDFDEQTKKWRSEQRPLTLFDLEELVFIEPGVTYLQACDLISENEEMLNLVEGLCRMPFDERRLQSKSIKNEKVQVISGFKSDEDGRIDQESIVMCEADSVTCLFEFELYEPNEEGVRRTWISPTLAGTSLDSPSSRSPIGFGSEDCSFHTIAELPVRISERIFYRVPGIEHYDQVSHDMNILEFIRCLVSPFGRNISRFNSQKDVEKSEEINKQIRKMMDGWNNENDTDY